MDQREAALHFIKSNGPSLPVQVAKALNTEILFGSAVLSELVSRKIVKMTHAAIGGSKLYYIPGQEAMLGDKLYHALKPIEKEAFDLLKQAKVLRDKELEPKHRIALRDLKDFAVQLTVKEGGQTEIFWKFHIIKDEEAKPLIEQYIEVIPESEVQKVEVKQEVKQEQPKMEDVVAKLKEEIMKELAAKQIQEKVEVKPVVKEDVKEEVKPAVVEEIEDEEEVEEIKPVVKEPKKKKAKIAVREEAEEQEETKEQIAEYFVDNTKKPEGKFYDEIVSFFNDSGIKVLKEEMIKKEKEYDFIVRVPSAFGIVSYFVKARDKKTFNDSDVSLAYSTGQLKGLPTILMGKGKLNKKAIQLIDEKLAGKFVFKEFN